MSAETATTMPTSYLLEKLEKLRHSASHLNRLDGTISTESTVLADIRVNAEAIIAELDSWVAGV